MFPVEDVHEASDTQYKYAEEILHELRNYLSIINKTLQKVPLSAVERNFLLERNSGDAELDRFLKDESALKEKRESLGARIRLLEEKLGINRPRPVGRSARKVDLSGRRSAGGNVSAAPPVMQRDSARPPQALNLPTSWQRAAFAIFTRNQGRPLTLEERTELLQHHNARFTRMKRELSGHFNGSAVLPLTADIILAGYAAPDCDPFDDAVSEGLRVVAPHFAFKKKEGAQPPNDILEFVSTTPDAVAGALASVEKGL